MTAIEKFKKVIPVLSENLHKGSCGRVGVIGGSLEYTGAPYFAAISALRAGADLVHVFCSRSAGPVIKSYSPELIVHPLLDAVDAVRKIVPWFSRLHALVIGPGLGRDPAILQTVRFVIREASNIPLVVDADGLFMLQQNPKIFNPIPRVLILTPNSVEYDRLLDGIHSFPRAYVLVKGKTDIIRQDGKDISEITEPGSLRRCGGQGDILSGLVGIFSAWTHLAQSDDFTSAIEAASTLTRRCSNLAFQKHRRSMLASNMIEMLPQAFEEILVDENTEDGTMYRL